VNFSERWKLLLAAALWMGAVIFPLGVLLQTISHGAVPRAVAIVGSGLVIAGLAGTAAGVILRGSHRADVG
jgi:hypothetical protein